MWQKPTPEQAQRGAMAVLVSRTTDVWKDSIRIARYNQTPYSERTIKRRVRRYYHNLARGIELPTMPDFLNIEALAIEWGIFPEVIDNAA